MMETSTGRKFEVRGIVLTEEEKRKCRYVAGVKKMLDDIRFDWFLTLTFKHAVKDRFAAVDAIENFLDRLSEKAFGRRSKKRITSFPVIEEGYFDNSLHVHMMIQDPTSKIHNPERRNQFNLRDAVIESWLQASSSAGNPALTAASDEWIKRIDNVGPVVEYMTKQIHSTLNSDPIVWDQVSLDGRRIRP